MKTIENIFAQEKRIIDAINKEGQALINTTSFEEWDNIEDRLEHISKRRRRVFNISKALRDQEHARMDCIAGDIRQILQIQQNRRRTGIRRGLASSERDSQIPLY